MAKSTSVEKAVKVNYELVDILDFHYIRDHTFSSNDDAQEKMRKAFKEYDKKHKRKKTSESDEEDDDDHLMKKLIVDSGENFKVRTSFKGFGLYAARKIVGGEELCMYLGKISMQDNYDKSSNYVFFFKGTEFCADSKFDGNLSRYINHSCHWEIQWFKEKCYPVLIAEHDILPGEELTYDYNYYLPPNTKNHPCLCGAKKCNVTFGKVAAKESVCGLRYQNVNGRLKMTPNVCKEKFKNEGDMYLHRFTDHYAGKKLECFACRDTKRKSLFTKLENYMGHCNRIHLEDREQGKPWGTKTIRIPCDTCGMWTNYTPTKWEDHLVKCKGDPTECDEENRTWIKIDAEATITDENLEQNNDFQMDVD